MSLHITSTAEKTPSSLPRSSKKCILTSLFITLYSHVFKINLSTLDIHAISSCALVSLSSCFFLSMSQETSLQVSLLWHIIVIRRGWGRWLQLYWDNIIWTKRIIDIRFHLANVSLAFNFMVVGTFNSDIVQKLGLSAASWPFEFLSVRHHGWRLR